MKTSTNPIESALGIFKQYKALADKAMEQLSDEEYFRLPDPESNSIAVIVKHVNGNLLSRWTDFLTTDGEKEWRDRDGEFEMDKMTRGQLLATWEKAWQCLFSALEPLTRDDLGKIITIRNEPHSVLEAINRSLAHVSYHVGQIVFLAKMFKSEQWQTLTIAKRKSREFNQKMSGA
ncbi:MAG: DUF1572 family protein [Bacteroidota bacterium]